jgi:F0F1-type ATP synthase epsilon subunit
MDLNTTSNHNIKLDIVTPEQSVYSYFVDYISFSGVDGELGILPHRCLLITMLNPGELRIKTGKTVLSKLAGNSCSPYRFRAYIRQFFVL